MTDRIHIAGALCLVLGLGHSWDARAQTTLTYFVDPDSNRLLRIEQEPGAARSLFLDYDASGNVVGTVPGHVDHDADGLTTYDERIVHLTDPLDADSDDDGLTDGAEVNVHGTDPNDADTDDDGIPDGEEIRARRVRKVLPSVYELLFRN